MAAIGAGEASRCARWAKTALAAARRERRRDQMVTPGRMRSARTPRSSGVRSCPTRCGVTRTKTSASPRATLMIDAMMRAIRRVGVRTHAIAAKPPCERQTERGEMPQPRVVAGGRAAPSAWLVRRAARASVTSKRDGWAAYGAGGKTSSEITPNVSSSCCPQSQRRECVHTHGTLGAILCRSPGAFGERWPSGLCPGIGPDIVFVPCPLVCEHNLSSPHAVIAARSGSAALRRCWLR